VVIRREVSPAVILPGAFPVAIPPAGVSQVAMAEEAAEAVNKIGTVEPQRGSLDPLFLYVVDRHG
jgi:hypothetical protein